jgi:DNA primase
VTSRIPEEKVEEIRTSVDIVDVISDYVQLKKQGRNYFGLCPFHGENTPSFSVSMDKQIFHCFGCGAGGNVFTFLMDLDGLTFPEALSKTAQRVGIQIDIEQDDQQQPKTSSEHEQMIQAHELVKKLYHHFLLNTKEGQDALLYLENRGINRNAIERFQIGWSLPSWDFTVKWLRKRGLPLELMEKAGLVIRREGSDEYVDRFRNRIMFPIEDSKGKTVAFSGRAIGDENPKYLNSPETLIFHKSDVLFHLSKARQAIRKQHQVVLFEGFADVIAAETAGVGNGVATMGTALSSSHIQAIKRLTDRVLICYDGDKAGKSAAFKAGEMFQKDGLNVNISLIPDQLDPDDYIREFGSDKFQREIIGASVTFMSYKIHYFRQGKNMNHEGDRLRYIEEVVKEISKLSNPIEKEHYLKHMSDEFSIPLDALRSQESKQISSLNKIQKPEITPQLIQNQSSGWSSNKLAPAYVVAERRLLFYASRNTMVIERIQKELVDSGFYIDEHQALFTYLLGWHEEGHNLDSGAFLHYLPDKKLRKYWIEIEMMKINEELSEKELQDYVAEVLKHRKMLKIKEKQLEAKEAERKKDYHQAAVIAMEILQLRKMLH